MPPWTVKCTDVPQFEALAAAAASFSSDEKLHLRILCNDSARCAGLLATHNSVGGRRIVFDYSRQQVTGETMELLYDLADAVGFTERRADMRSGRRINTSEDRPVLHHVLRMPKGHDYFANPDGPAILKEVHDVRDRVEDFSRKVRRGEYVGLTGKPLVNVLCIGVGGTYLGPEFVMEALRADGEGEAASKGRTLRFLANVDPVDFHLSTRDLDPAETLVVVVSRTFSTAETMLNARTVRKWLIAGIEGAAKDVVAHHMLAVTTNIQKCREFGIADSKIFAYWDWVGCQFSVCSAVGLLPLSLHYSYDVMSQFLSGAHDIDTHFFTAPLRDNIPLALGLLGVWNSTFLGYESRAVLPYAQALKRFPAYIQQLDMGSNGKRVAIDGTPILHRTGEINFGEPGTTGQYSFYQLLQQGRVVPADFIGFIQSQHPLYMTDEAVSNHDELMAHFFARPDALAYGKTLSDLVQEGVAPELREHQVIPGNRPSSSILMTKLDAFAVGQLLALYEHRTVVQGFIWGINSFDQYGVQLGNNLARQVRTQLRASRRTGASVQGFNSSTTSLLDVYLQSG